LLGKYQQLASQLHAEVMLEVVVQSLTDFASELHGVAQMAKRQVYRWICWLYVL
jgi:hypothetical protein